MLSKRKRLSSKHSNKLKPVVEEKALIQHKTEELPEGISEELRKALEKGGVSSEKIETIIGCVHQSLEYHSGPLPHPDILRRYDKVVPGLAKDIVSQFKLFTAHQRKIQLLRINKYFAFRKRGQTIGLIISFGCLVASVICAFVGQTTVASIIGGTTVVYLVTAYVVGKVIK